MPGCGFRTRKKTRGNTPQHEVKLHHAFQTPGCLVLILQYCPGGNLSSLLQREGHLPEPVAKAGRSRRGGSADSSSMDSLPARIVQIDRGGSSDLGSVLILAALV